MARRAVVRVLVRIDSQGEYVAAGASGESDDKVGNELNWVRDHARGERDVFLEVEVDLPERPRVVRAMERAR